MPETTYPNVLHSNIHENQATEGVRELARLAEPRADSVYAALDALEAVGNEDAIAEYLETWGHRGHQSAADECPVALYLRAKLRITVYVSQTDWSLAGKFGDIDSAADAFPLPPYVSSFIEAFDDDQYPRLVK